jgi:hypothetical protein
MTTTEKAMTIVITPDSTRVVRRDTQAIVWSRKHTRQMFDNLGAYNAARNVANTDATRITMGLKASVQS